MKYKVLILFLIFSTSLYALLPIGEWQMHGAYNSISSVIVGNSKVYAISNGALLSVDKEDGTIEYYDKISGLSSFTISKAVYDEESGKLLITFADGSIDFLDDEGGVTAIADLYLSQTSESKIVNNIYIHDRTAYLAMTFGLLQLNLTKQEVKDTYYIGYEAGSVDVKYVAVCNDSIYALSADTLYYSGLKSNKIDYHNWKTMSLPGSGNLMGIETINNELFLLRDSIIYKYSSSRWTSYLPSNRYRKIKALSGKLIGLNSTGTDVIENGVVSLHSSYFPSASDIDYDSQTNTYWYAILSSGVGAYYVNTSKYTQFQPNGPISNIPYRIRFTGDRLFMVPGGYFAVKDNTPATAMFYENGNWTNFNSSYFNSAIGYSSTDYSDILGDPNDPTHFFIATFSTGLIEFRNDMFYKLYDVNNSPFKSAIESKPSTYTWVDGLTYDTNGNLYVECIESGLCVLTPNEKWVTLNNAATNNFNRSKQVLISNRNPNIKIIVNNRNGAGIGVMDDRGTLENTSDDRAVFYHNFIDQNGNSVTPEDIYYIEQDLDGELWVGTSTGVFIVHDVETLFYSNECRRVIIPRTDGSGLADYLLADEKIKAIAIDGANRKWIGTEGSGLYLLSADGTETIEHFTIDNSPLPDNTILSIAIHPRTGEVYVGTGAGLVSYQSDAAPSETAIPNDNLYVYPNPVYKDGIITVKGLKNNTIVKVTDVSGNLVVELKSLGSLATWNGTDGSGRRVSTGVYIMQCVTEDGQQYAITKVLIIK